MLLTTQKLSHVWHPKFNKFRDLIYMPLDLPKPPEIDLDLFMDWVNSCPKIVDLIKCPDTGEKILHFEEKGLQGWGYYPWIQVSPLHHGYSKEWIAGFDKIFPEVVEYINLFPFNILSGITILVQKSGNTVPLHVDPDDWLGLRFFLKNKVEREILYFTPTKEPMNYRLGSYRFDGNRVHAQQWENYLDMDKKLYARHPEPEHAWCLNGLRAAHGLDPFESGEFSRVTVLVHSHKGQDFTTAWNQDRLYDLLDRSLKKYEDYALWWGKN